MRRMRSGVGRSRSTVKPDGTSDNSERGSRTGHGKQSGSCRYGHSSRIVHRPAPKLRKNPYSTPNHNLVFSVAVQLGQHLLAAFPPTPDRGDLLGQVLDPGPGGAGFSCISMVEPLQVVLELGVGETDELCQGGSRKVAILVVDSLDPGAVDGEQLLAEQVQLAAQQHELAEHRAEDLAVDAAEIRYGLKVGLQMPQQPDHLDIAVGLASKAAAGASTVQIAVDVELQQVRRSITRTARRLRNRADKPKRREVQSVDKRLDEPHRVVGRDVIVTRLR